MRPLIVANWKMNPQTSIEAKRLLNSLKKAVKGLKKTDVIICPPFIYIPILIAAVSVNRASVSSKFVFGAQDCFLEKEGAFTGEISPLMLKNLKCNYVIIGHSERKKYLKEDDKMINKKLKKCLEVGISPILCIGEDKKQKDKGNAQKVIGSQIKNGLRGIKKEDINNLLIAYEPIWAIGTGKSCLPEEVKVMSLIIKRYLTRLYGSDASKKARILYGGSVVSENASKYIKDSDISGLLIGSASLDAKEFAKILKNLA
ncbi:MAG: triose-phosphate isomerase [Patescibacteria group bacterium]|nr:triose-phosphate isomerase [Patescibacteria group bacterium]